MKQKRNFIHLHSLTALKQCCEAAILQWPKKKHDYDHVKAAEVEADLKLMIQLIDSNWKFEISSQALDDLNLAKWNKITIVPLASDLKILKKFLDEKAHVAAQALSKKQRHV